MITVRVNSEPTEIPTDCPVADALTQWGYQCEQIAVAINNEFVPRSNYQQRILQTDDCVDIVAPVQGG